jgi:hypothetical protein
MMPVISLQEMGAVVEVKLPQLQAALASGLDFAGVERALQETMAQLTATMLERLLAALMQEAGFVAQLKRLGGSARDAAEGVPAGAATSELGARD